MRRARLADWLASVLETRDEEISCSECLERIPAYVEFELAGIGEAEPHEPLRQHLGQCRVCHEEYIVLKELAQGDFDGETTA